MIFFIFAHFLSAQESSLLPQISAPLDKIKDPFWQEYFWHIITVIGALFLLLAFVFRPRKKILLTPYQIAMHVLADAKSLPESANAKHYAELISGALRDYIGAVYTIPAPERTTFEFLNLLKSSTIFDDIAQEKLSKILELSDMAKFAQHNFQQAEKDELYIAVHSFIEKDNEAKEAHKE